MIKNELRMPNLAKNPTPIILLDYDAGDGNILRDRIDADKTQWTTTANYVYPIELQTIIAQNITLKMENQKLRQELQNATSYQSEFENVIELRDISRDQAKSEITKFFTDHYGDVIYPSDIAEALNLSYILVEEIIEELEDASQIRRTSK